MNSDIDVESGLLAEECNAQMSEFMHWCENMRPEVLLKAAIDANGRVDCDPNESAQRFSSPESLEIVHALRADSMAILVGVDTEALCVAALLNADTVLPKYFVSNVSELLFAIEAIFLFT